MVKTDKLYCWDIGSRNVAGARLHHLMAVIKARPGLLALQEVPAPRHTDWVNLVGYLFIRSCGGDKQGCVAIGIRSDIGNKFIEAVDAQTRRTQIRVMAKNDSKNFNMMAVYKPPAGSRHDRDGKMEMKMAQAATLDFVCGDFNWRPTTADINETWPQHDATELPGDHAGWKATRDMKR